jgi:hypothetical protein
VHDVSQSVKLESTDTLVTLVDPEIGRVYMNSEQAVREIFRPQRHGAAMHYTFCFSLYILFSSAFYQVREFSDRSATARQCIALARRLQDPLAAISGLWSEQQSGTHVVVDCVCSCVDHFMDECVFRFLFLWLLFLLLGWSLFCCCCSF